MPQEKKISSSQIIKQYLFKAKNTIITMTSKSNERKEALFRIIVAIVTGIILGVWQYLISVLGIINFFITLISGKRNKEFADFSEYWNTEYYKFIRYLTFVTNRRPFPFTPMERMSKFSN